MVLQHLPGDHKTNNMANLKQIIDIDGVILSPEAITNLSCMQSENNSMLRGYELTLYKVIKYMAMQKHCGDSSNKEDLALDCLITELAFIIDSISDFKKP